MSKKRHVYLKKQSLQDARKIFLERFANYCLSSETILAAESVGRILAEPVFAKISCPNFHASAMDGIAVCAENTFGINENRPKELAIGKEAFFINTGNVLPESTNAVIMIENVQITDNNTAIIEAPALPWQHVRKMGEDIVATEMIFPRSHEITPSCIGALLSGGVFEVSVYKKPTAFIIPTGSELIDWQQTDLKNLKQGQIIESNSTMLGKLIESHGGQYIRHDIVKDNAEIIAQVVMQGLNNDYDLILINGGSSAGSEDYSRDVIERLGLVLVHGVTIMPGKPVVLGVVENKPVIGMPGYPVSAIVAFEQFIVPLLCQMLRKFEPKRKVIQAKPVRNITSKLGVQEFLRVKLGIVDDQIVATPLPRGAGSITTFTQADGIIRIPENIEGFQSNQTVDVELLKPFESIKNAIVAVGSHDNCLDILADQLRKKHFGLSLSSSHVGSMGGIMAIKKGLCHIAGTHLLDPLDGSYNVSYIKKYLNDNPVVLINLVIREQGLIVEKRNPKNIKGIHDLIRKDVRFVNRQGGSGTRVLLDYELTKHDIKASDINGYQNEEFTHMAVAAAVLSNAADTGLGIHAAANALNLDFIPMVTEQYDLIIPKRYIETEAITNLIAAIRSDEFQKLILSFGGYKIEKTGRIVYE